MFGLVGINTKLVKWNKESWLSPALLLFLAEIYLEIIQNIVGCLVVVTHAP